MNICIVGTNIPPVMGGLEIYTYELAKHLAKRGNKVCLIGYYSLGSSLYETKDNIEIFRIPNLPIIDNKLYFIFAYLLVSKLHKVYNFDIIHAQTAAPAGVVGALMKYKYNLPYIITSHGYELIVRAKQFFVKPFVYVALKNAYKVIGVSNELSELSIKYGASRLKTVTLPNAVDTDTFSPVSEIDKNKIKKRLNLPLDKTIILCIRRLVPKTGIQYVIELAPDIIKQCKNVFFLIVGTGELEGVLKSKVKQMNLNDYFLFTGKVLNTEVIDYIRVCDLAIFPSLAEATSIACLEVMSCAKPVIASNVGGLPEIIKHNKTGILVDFRLTQSSYIDYGLNSYVLMELKDNILKLLKDKNLRNKLGQNAREHVIKNFSWDIYINKVLEIYYNARLC